MGELIFKMERGRGWKSVKRFGEGGGELEGVGEVSN